MSSRASLRLKKSNAVWLGVCSGVAEWLDIPAAVVRTVFVVSVILVWRYLASGDGAFAATASVVLKTLVLYTIMVTGSLWERDVFGQYLFARPFFWEDVVSMLVIALHTAYLVCVLFALLTVREQMYLALAAYLVYVINAAQFLIKFRLARRQVAHDDARTLAGVRG